MFVCKSVMHCNPDIYLDDLFRLKQFFLFGRDTAVRIFPMVFADFKDQQGPRPLGGVTYNSYPYFNHRNIKDLLIYLNLVSTCQQKKF